jgi:hypothetical protein
MAHGPPQSFDHRSQNALHSGDPTSVGAATALATPPFDTQWSAQS